MLTEDPTLIKWFDPPDGFYHVSARVFGFYCGYNAVEGKGKEYSSDPEYQKGWDEGKNLRFDEMKSDARKQGWKL